jgi:hypothetical protein
MRSERNYQILVLRLVRPVLPNIDSIVHLRLTSANRPVGDSSYNVGVLLGGYNQIVSIDYHLLLTRTDLFGNVTEVTFVDVRDHLEPLLSRPTKSHYQLLTRVSKVC